jgi:2-C-methyl-D-erythritol 4-phosphate cytidylyltransferase
MGGEDKLFAEICGAPVLAHTLAAFQDCIFIREIILVVREEKLELAAQICRSHNIGRVASIIVGGDTRLASVMNGVYAVSDKARLIAIHDGARPCVDAGVIVAALVAASESHAVAPAIAINSTLKRAKDGIVTETVGREDLYEIQTPQVFDVDLIKAALTYAAHKSIDITDDCMAVELLGLAAQLTEGARANIKITSREDLALADAIKRSSRFAWEDAS